VSGSGPAARFCSGKGGNVGVRRGGVAQVEARRKTLDTARPLRIAGLDLALDLHGRSLNGPSAVSVGDIAERVFMLFGRQSAGHRCASERHIGPRDCAGEPSIWITLPAGV
jgi:hypothetical protein